MAPRLLQVTHKRLNQRFYGISDRNMVQKPWKILEIDPDVRAIVASGYANYTVMVNYKNFGFVDSIPRPFSIDTLLYTVQEALTITSDSEKYHSSRRIRFCLLQSVFYAIIQL